VFTWNRHRFPDPAAFVAKYHAEGIRIIANIKPYVLSNHPEYENLKAANAFFTDPRTGKSGVARLWSAGGGESGEGGHIDFTSKAGYEWWYNGVKKLREVGIEGAWNDNNEYSIPDDDWELAVERTEGERGDEDVVGKKIGLWGRAIHCELMGKASHDALVDYEPEFRPFVLTRSATAGTMRYAASSWSGDNMTSWESTKGANSLALNAGFSLLQCYGHDIGGFEGPQPSPELLVRWVYLGVYSPRFAINCFKTDENDNTIGGVIEPWMYPEVTPIVREVIKRRYELIPYLYSGMLESHRTAVPLQRWMGWGYEQDENVWTEEVMRGETQYWLGDSLLVGGVYEPGETVARLYLPTSGPDDEGYLSMNVAQEYYEAGQWVSLDSQWKSGVPILARVGGAVVVGKDVQTRAPGDHRFPSHNEVEDDYRAVEIFPPKGSSKKTYEYAWLEDDGIAAKPKISSFVLRYSSTEDEIKASFGYGEEKEYRPLWKDLDIILPEGEKRAVVGAERVGGSRGRVVYRVKA
jgi:alpha-glucosidase (family GH31 glycosyl hydrolase)